MLLQESSLHLHHCGPACVQGGDSGEDAALDLSVREGALVGHLRIEKDLCVGRADRKSVV